MLHPRQGCTAQGRGQPAAGHPAGSVSRTESGLGSRDSHGAYSAQRGRSFLPGGHHRSLLEPAELRTPPRRAPRPAAHTPIPPRPRVCVSTARGAGGCGGVAAVAPGPARVSSAALARPAGSWRRSGLPAGSGPACGATGASRLGDRATTQRKNVQLVPTYFILHDVSLRQNYSS